MCPARTWVARRAQAVARHRCHPALPVCQAPQRLPRRLLCQQRHLKFRPVSLARKAAGLALPATGLHHRQDGAAVQEPAWEAQMEGALAFPHVMPVGTAATQASSPGRTSLHTGGQTAARLPAGRLWQELWCQRQDGHWLTSGAWKLSLECPFPH